MKNKVQIKTNDILLKGTLIQTDMTQTQFTYENRR